MLLSFFSSPHRPSFTFALSYNVACHFSDVFSFQIPNSTRTRKAPAFCAQRPKPIYLREDEYLVCQSLLLPTYHFPALLYRDLQSYLGESMNGWLSPKERTWSHRELDLKTVQSHGPFPQGVENCKTATGAPAKCFEKAEVLLPRSWTKDKQHLQMICEVWH